MKQPKAKNPVFLVVKFLDHKKLSKPEWAREVKIAKSLLEGKEDFFTKTYLSFKLNSLAWFLTDDGKKFILEEQLRHTLNFKKEEPVKTANKKFGKVYNKRS